MSNLNKNLVPGQEVWVVERGENGNACEISGYILLAVTVFDAVIVSPYINDLEDAADIVAYHIEQTAENYDTDLAVFPLEDCYADHEEARTALTDEKREG